MLLSIILISRKNKMKKVIRTVFIFGIFFFGIYLLGTTELKAQSNNDSYVQASPIIFPKEFNEGEAILLAISCTNYTSAVSNGVSITISFESPTVEGDIVTVTNSYISYEEEIYDVKEITYADGEYTIAANPSEQIGNGEYIVFGIEALATEKFYEADTANVDYECNITTTANQTITSEQREGTLTEVTSDSVAPIYRFWSQSLNKHFYTSSSLEKNIVMEKWSDTWSYEKPVMKGFYYDSNQDLCAKGTPVYRFWSSSLQSHFYAENGEVKEFVEKTWPETWSFEKIIFCADSEVSAQSHPVYRFWSEILGAHFYTNDVEELSYIEENWGDIWSREGVKFYAPII